jgi:glycosyltransferase involved in cell wall biosynthesis
VEAQAVTATAALTVEIGGGAGKDLAECLSMGWHAGADVPFHPSEDFPFDDRVVGVIACENFLHDLDRAARLHFLLECRRTLQPGGRVTVAPRAGTGSSGTNLSRVAALAGLDAVPGGFTKRDRQLHGDPLVSILIPAYNPGFFAASFESALEQTYANIEIVICDDSPGPEIEAMVRAGASRAPVRYFRNTPRLRPRGNFTRCFEEARGEFVKFLCDDDLLALDCVASLLDAFRYAPDITLATSRRRRIDESGRSLRDQPATTPIVAGDAVIAGTTLANAMLMAGLNTIGEPSTVLFRKAELLDQAPWFFRFDGVEGHGVIDMVTWAALLLKGDAVYRTDALSSFRVHPGQRQHDPSKSQRNVDSIRELQAAWLDLKLHERSAPDVLRTRSFPPGNEEDWRAQPVIGFAARPLGAS